MKDGKLHHRTPDLTGQRFGALVVMSPAHSDGRKRYWEARCDCGNIVVKCGSDLKKEQKRGGTPNCGCLTKTLIGEKNTRHGMTDHPAYWVWRSMRDRCRLPSHHAWRNYGGRGIRVCERWGIFEAFWEDMGPAYQKGLTLDRIDNDGPYSPENCRWVSMKIQSRNKRTNTHMPTPFGEMTVSEASEVFGIGVTTLLYRLAAGWPEDYLLIDPDVKNRVGESLTS